MPHVDLREILTQELKAPEWVVDRFIPRDTITVLAGLEGIGKSSLSYSLALSVALGVPFLERTTTRLKVLYFDSENSRPDFADYLRQLWIGLKCPPIEQVSAFLRIEHFSLGPSWRETFMQVCRQWEPGLVIVDTANACFYIKDENSNAEAAEIVSFLQRARPARAAIVLMKHEREPKEGAGKSVRGAKYWLGAVDQVVYLHRAPGRPDQEAKVTKLHRTRLIPAKHRAWGLEELIEITPEAISTPLGKGLIFKTKPAAKVPPSLEGVGGT